MYCIKLINLFQVNRVEINQQCDNVNIRCEVGLVCQSIYGAIADPVCQ